MTTFNVATVLDNTYHGHPCVAKALEFPSPLCPKRPGPPLATFMLRVLSILLPSKAPFHLRFLPADGYWNPQASLNGSSVVSLVGKGEADMSMPIINLNAARYAVVGYTAPVFRTYEAVLYRKRPPERVKLTITALIPIPIVYAIALLATFKASIVFGRRILPTCPKIRKKLTLYNPPISPVSKLTNALAWTLFLNTYAGHLTTLFIRPLPKRLPFQKPGDLRRNPENYTIISDSPNTERLLGRKVSLIPSARMNRWLAHPPKDLLASHSRLALLTDEPILMPVWRRQCELSLFVDRDIYIGSHIIFNRSNKPGFRKLASIVTIIGSREAGRTGIIPIKGSRHCPNTDQSFGLNLEQLEPGFGLFAAVLGNAVIFLLFENVIQISWCNKVV